MVKKIKLFGRLLNSILFKFFVLSIDKEEDEKIKDDDCKEYQWMRMCKSKDAIADKEHYQSHGDRERSFNVA